MTVLIIMENLFLSIIISSVIGLNREYKDSPAGLRTYNLVCLGAVIITMVSKELSDVAIQKAILNPDIQEVFDSDTTKIIGEIVSGIGFLGAGTIIVSHKRIKGLSTASSIWVTAALGISIGLRYYTLAILGVIFTVLILTFFNKIRPIRMLKQISITFTDEDIGNDILQYFENNDLKIKKIDTKIFSVNTDKKINSTYTFKPSKNLNLNVFVLSLGKINGISDVEFIEVS